MAQGSARLAYGASAEARCYHQPVAPQATTTSGR